MLCHLCGTSHMTRSVLQTTASKSYKTWSRYRYHHHYVINHLPRLEKVMQGESGMFASSAKLQLDGAIRGHSTCSTPKTWVKPEGYDSGVMIYHPVVKDKVPLILRQEKLAQWYSCGPTVYDSTHIGHASSYVRLDIIRRILGSVFDIDTTLVMGVTDVDDKIIERAKVVGRSVDQLSRFYESEFFASMANLNVSPPSVITRVTEHIPPIIQFIAEIEKQGLAYKAKDESIYFDVKKYGKYGVFTASKTQTRPAEAELIKKNVADFALWKAAKPGEPWWQSPWGPGRPGWHIECSAMASGIFGANFDIHAGGEDLMFPHHENEVAQSCAYHGTQQWANYWIHTGHLFQSGQQDKMSKSLKNVITVSEFLEDYTPNHFRMLCLLSNYRKRIEFSADRVQKAVSVMSACNSLISRCDSYVKGQINCEDISGAELYEILHSSRRKIEKAFADDFNTPQALATLMRLVKSTNQLLQDEVDGEKQESYIRSNAPVAAVGVYVRRLLKQLGLDIGRMKAEEETETHLRFYEAVETLVSSRTKIRNFAKDKKFMTETAEEVGIPKDQASKLMKKLYQPLWQISDDIRANILRTANVQINDDVQGSSWSVVDTKKKTAQGEQENNDSSRQIDMKKLNEKSAGGSNEIQQKTSTPQS